jgi:two-component system sensor histidine kinase UhpB
MLYCKLMRTIARKSQSIFNQLQSLSIYQKIAIGNSIIIIAGAIGGTLLTRHLTDRAADFSLIVLFASIGILLSMLINFLMLNSALRPLRELGRLADLLSLENTYLPSKVLETDPDIARLAKTLDSLIHQLEQRNVQLRALSERAINAQEEERQRIARSLHDDTGQAISTILFKLESLETQLPQGDRCAEELSKTRDLASATLKELKKIISDLRPSVLDDLGLVPAIRWYARSNLESAGISLDFQAPESIDQIPPEITTTLFRISQEAINNIVKHSQAKKVNICLLQENDRIIVRIDDHGIGFIPAKNGQATASPQHWGLTGIKERVELVGGEVEISSAPGKGTQIHVSVPAR